MTGAQLLPPAELAGVFTAAGVALDQPLVCSCGSGLTAAVLALALHEVRRTPGKQRHRAESPMQPAAEPWACIQLGGHGRAPSWVGMGVHPAGWAWACTQLGEHGRAPHAG